MTAQPVIPPYPQPSPSWRFLAPAPHGTEPMRPPRPAMKSAECRAPEAKNKNEAKSLAAIAADGPLGLADPDHDFSPHPHRSGRSGHPDARPRRAVRRRREI